MVPVWTIYEKSYDTFFKFFNIKINLTNILGKKIKNVNIYK